MHCSHDAVMQQFAEWLAAARACMGEEDATAMTLATATRAGAPSARVVLLKGVDARGFVFFTNYESRKGHELAENPRAALCFYWPPLGRQVRVEGRAERVSEAAADEYFASRARASQLGAWASAQSQPLENPQTLVQRLAALTAQYGDKPVPRPPHWGGFRVVPERMEFWSRGEFRLHERECYTRTGYEEWALERLYP